MCMYISLIVLYFCSSWINIFFYILSGTIGRGFRFLNGARGAANFLFWNPLVSSALGTPSRPSLFKRFLLFTFWFVYNKISDGLKHSLQVCSDYKHPTDRAYIIVYGFFPHPCNILFFPYFVHFTAMLF